MIDDIILRRYEERDKEQVLNLLNKNFEKQQHLSILRDSKWWSWKYEESIFGKPIIYVAEKTGKIVGVRPLWPWKLNIRTKELNCFQALDSAVDEEYRGAGLFSKLTRKAILENKEEIDLIFNFPNQQSIGAYTNLGWSFVGKLEWYVKINSPIKSLKLIKNYSNLKSLALENSDVITSIKIDAIKEKSSFDSTLKTKRSSSFLSWRYLNHPVINYGMDIIKSGRKQLSFVYEINENKYGKELIIVDYFGDLCLFDDMLKNINKISTKYETAHVLILRKFNTPSKVLLKHLYLKQKKKNFVVLPIDLQINEISTKYDNWDLFLGMHDSI